ncbi:MAG: nuclear transport factor 2 family protein [Chitinophagales bacterium]|nr:nuclear transport factor 2 family protein [Chitinophagales bacterium]
MESEKIIEHFYQSFATGDAEKMVGCYHDQIEFTDPAFGLLKGEAAKNMWRMLLEGAKGKIKIEFSNVSADNETGSAQWIATYQFSETGRKVVNKITAHFEFKDGKIFRHTDSFDLHKWAKQALGFKGVLLGGTKYFQNKLQQKTSLRLAKYSSRKKE